MSVIGPRLTGFQPKVRYTMLIEGFTLDRGHGGHLCIYFDGNGTIIGHGGTRDEINFGDKVKYDRPQDTSCLGLRGVDMGHTGPARPINKGPRLDSFEGVAYRLTLPGVQHRDHLAEVPVLLFGPHGALLGWGFLTDAPSRVAEAERKLQLTINP